MKRLSIIMAAGLAAALAVNAARAAVDMAGWKTYRNDADGYEFKYPSSLSLSIPSGSVCTNDDCKPLEEVTLRRYTPADGSIRMLQFTIQRGINPHHLPMQQWYESLAQRPLDPAFEHTVTIAGRAAVTRGPPVPGVTGRIEGGKTVSATEALLEDDTTMSPSTTATYFPSTAIRDRRNGRTSAAMWCRPLLSRSETPALSR